MLRTGAFGFRVEANAKLCLYNINLVGGTVRRFCLPDLIEPAPAALTVGIIVCLESGVWSVINTCGGGCHRKVQSQLVEMEQLQTEHFWMWVG